MARIDDDPVALGSPARYQFRLIRDLPVYGGTLDPARKAFAV